MRIGFWEVAFLLILFFGIILISRIVTHFQTKRVCPNCGLAIRIDVRRCPECGHEFPLKVSS